MNQKMPRDARNIWGSGLRGRSARQREYSTILAVRRHRGRPFRILWAQTMAEPSSPPDDKPPEFSDSTLSVRSGGIDIAAQQVSVGGDVVGRDKIVTGYTADQVQALLVQISASFQPRPFDGRCPYLGLDAFGEEDADRFFGREKLVADLIARVRDSRFVMIAGPSGSGKSSLVRAGLLHQLRHGALPGSERWLYTVLKPGRDPLEQLALAMARMAKSPDAGHYIRRSGASHADILHESAESLLSDRRDQRAVIVVDQFGNPVSDVAVRAGSSHSRPPPPARSSGR